MRLFRRQRAARYGPNTPTVEAFLARLKAVTPLDWQTKLDFAVYRPSADPTKDLFLSHRPGTNMPRGWEEAYWAASRAADPDRTQAWLNAVEDAGRAVSEAAIRGMLALMEQRPMWNYVAFVSRLPGGVDPRQIRLMERGLTASAAAAGARSERDASDASAASLACLAVAGNAACAYVVRDRIEPAHFVWLVDALIEVIPRPSDLTIP